MSENLLVALMVTEGAQPSALDWLTSNAAPYLTIDVIDFPATTRDRVNAIYQAAYARLGALVIASADGLFKYNRWFLIYDTQTIDADTFPAENLLSAFVLCRDTCAGIKVGLMGSDTRRGARALLEFATQMLMVYGVFAEVSGPAETHLARNVPVVGCSDAISVLEQLGHMDAAATGGDHYRRHIKRLGPTEKLMIGRPRLGRS